MLLGEEVFVMVVLQMSLWIILHQGERSGNPLSAHGEGQGIIPKHLPHCGISCMERCAHALRVLVNAPVNHLEKSPQLLRGGPADAVQASPAPAFWLRLCRGSGAGKEQLWLIRLTTYPGMSLPV